MDLETRAYFSTWTSRVSGGVTTRTPRLLFYAPEINGQSWSAVEVPDQDQCLVLLTYDKDISGAAAAAAAFAAVEAAPSAEALEIGELSQDLASRPTLAAVLARCDAHRIPSSVVGSGTSVRWAAREIARRALLFQEVGYPPAELSETIGVRLQTFQSRAVSRGFAAARAVLPSTTIGTAYAILATSPRADYGLSSGAASFGHPAVHLGVGGGRV